MATAPQPTHSSASAAPAKTGLPDEALTPDVSAAPKDFKLAPVGSRDWVAGQPIDQAEFDKTQADAKKRHEEGQKALADAKKRQEEASAAHK